MDENENEKASSLSPSICCCLLSDSFKSHDDDDDLQKPQQLPFSG